MKKTTLLVLMTAFAASAFAQTEVSGKIEKVTIYPNAALVEKSITVNLKQGENKFVISGNATEVGTNAVHFATSNQWYVSSMYCQPMTVPVKTTLSHMLPASAYSQYIALSDKLDDIKLQKKVLEGQQSAYRQQRQALNNIKALQKTASFDTIERLDAQFKYQVSEVKRNIVEYDKIEKQLAELSYQQHSVTAEIEQLLSKHTGGPSCSNSQNNIVVTIYAARAMSNAKIEYHYQVRSVHSQYSYDVMFDEKAHHAVFALKNSVSQHSGEHWKDCPIVFSTTMASFIGYDPELSPVYLQQATNTLYSRKMEANAFTSTARGESGMVKWGEAEESADAVVPSAVQNLTLGREYTLMNPQTIASGEREQIIQLVNDTTKADFSRYATPKNGPTIYYTALLPDWEDLALQDVPCNIYLNNRFVSVSQVSTATAADTMRFSIGDDKNVKVLRKVLRTTPDKTGPLSKEIDENITITLQVKNTKDERVSLSIKDQIPLSMFVDVKVLNIQTDGGMLDEKTGTIRWELNLDARAEKTIKVSFTVRHPKDPYYSYY